jgi:hypothetical protein
MLDPDSYIPQDKAKLLIRLVEVTTSLAELYTQQHTATVEYYKQLYACYTAYPDISEAAKKRVGDQETYFLKETIDDLNTQILVYQEERDMLKFLIGQLDG